MFHLELSRMIAEVSPVTGVITPFLPLIGTLVGAILVGLFALWNRRRGNYETRAPDVNEIWLQQAKDSHDLDAERYWRRLLENFAYETLAVFRGYVKRVKAGGSTELSPREQKFYDADPPNPERNAETKF